MKPQEVAELSLEQALRRFDESVEKLIEVVAGDHVALLVASRIISDQPVDAQGPEHIAFAYITAAYKRMTRT